MAKLTSAKILGCFIVYRDSNGGLVAEKIKWHAYSVVLSSFDSPKNPFKMVIGTNPGDKTAADHHCWNLSGKGQPCPFCKRGGGNNQGSNGKAFQTGCWSKN